MASSSLRRILCISVALACVACGREPAERSDETAGRAGTALEDRPPAAEGVVLDDGQVLGVVMAMDSIEVAAASLARTGELSEPVLAFASEMQREHSEHLAKGRELASEAGLVAAEPPLAAQLRQEHAHHLDALRTLQGGAFETAFLAHVVQGHTDAVRRLEEILDSPRAGSLKGWVEESRDQFAHHLERAQELRAATTQ